METQDISSFQIHNIPPEILSLAFSQVSTPDLLNCELVSKAWLKLLHNNISIWQEVAKELDLVLDVKNLKQAQQMAKIRQNILHCRFVLSVLAVAATKPLNKVYIKNSSFNDNCIVVNWFHDQYHYIDHTVMVELKTRAVKPQYRQVLYGPFLTQTYEDYYGQKIGIQGTRHAELDENNQVVATTSLPKAKIYIHNEELSKQHLIALIRTEKTKKMDLQVQIYDLQKKTTICEILLLNYGNNDDFLPKTSVLFAGDKIYTLKLGIEEIVTVVDINKPEEHHVINIDGLPRYSTLTGVSETFMFGTTAVTKEVWCYNSKSKTMASYKRQSEESVQDVKWYCGTLMVFESHGIVFLDPYSNGTELKVIGTLVTDGMSRATSRICEDGKFFLASQNGSVRMLDFLHVNDNVQLLEVSGPKNTAPHNIKSYQLTEALTRILGTENFHSRYLNISGEERYGVAFIPPNPSSTTQEGPKLAVNMKRMNINPEYNSPYFAAHMVPHDKEIPRTTVYEVSQTLQSIHKVAVLFYEQFDGKNWRLSMPRDWRKGLALLFG